MIEFKDKQKTIFSRKKILAENATESELTFKQMLDENKIKYIFQKAFIKGNNYVIVDFYIPKPYKICIEIDGPYHEREGQKVRDYNKDQYLKSRGFNIIRIKNEEVKNFDIKTLF